MAILNIHIDKIIENVVTIDNLMKKNDKEWSLVVKVLGAHKAALQALMEHEIIRGIHSLAVSQWKILKLIKEINPNIVTTYIKPPVIKNADHVVRYADISFNSSFLTIKALNEAAKKQNKEHQIVIMIEMGELREGIRREGLVEFYQKVFQLSNIRVIGIGSNLGCMIGIQPSYDKLLQMVLYEQLIEAVFKQKVKLVSGASSITLPLLQKGKVPKGVNHFRIGEAAFLGTSPLNNRQFANLHTDTFTFDANIVELYRKSNQPSDLPSDAAVGSSDFNASVSTLESSYHAITDFGVLDVDAHNLIPMDDSVKFFGNSSDLTVFDLGENPGQYETGHTLHFKLKYMAVARLMSAGFVEKKICF